MDEAGELPLLAWGAAAHDKHRRARLRRRRNLGLVGAVGCALATAPVLCPPQPRLVWNASASAPIGLYRVEPPGRLARGDMVIARVPVGVRALAARRHYVPADVPLVKRIAGVSGDTVCAIGGVITINGRTIARRRTHDRDGRPLPWWTGCQRLGLDMVFLLMAAVPGSFDGRYFGPTPRADLIGKARLLWAR